MGIANADQLEGLCRCWVCYATAVRFTSTCLETHFLTICRLLAIAAARLLSLSKAFSSDDLTFSLATPAAWAQVEMHYNIIAATIPCLRIFLKDFTTGWLGTRSNRMEECTRSTKSNTYGSRHSAVRKAGDVLHIELQPRGRGQVESKIEHDAMNDAASDDSQQRIFVNRRIDIMYEER